MFLHGGPPSRCSHVALDVDVDVAVAVAVADLQSVMPERPVYGMERGSLSGMVARAPISTCRSR